MRVPDADQVARWLEAVHALYRLPVEDAGSWQEIRRRFEHRSPLVIDYLSFLLRSLRLTNDTKRLLKSAGLKTDQKEKLVVQFHRDVNVVQEAGGSLAVLLAFLDANPDPEALDGTGEEDRSTGDG